MAAQIPQGNPPPLQHPLIGSLQGRYGKGAVQYLGIQYASLENRLAEPQVMEYPERLNLDTRKHGPPVITPAGAADMEMSFIQQHLPKPELPPMSDTKGLNLNITVPIDGGENLPVMVYIHGGGFAFGSSAYPHYDQTKVVELSGIMDRRVVAVNLNYRLGIPGFLTSDELRKAGFKANRGLLDQKAALQWVKRYISGFGGDPQRVTVIGQSAGAASVNFHMHSRKPLFQKAVLVGGSFLMMRPATTELAEELYGALTSRLGLDKLAPEQRIKGLLTVAADDLVQFSPELVALGPVIDNDSIPSMASFSNIGHDEGLHLPGKTWCKELFLIESQFDGSIFALVNLNNRQDGINAAFTRSIRESLGDAAASKLLDAYRISPKTSDLDTLEKIINFVTDASFYAPAVKLGQAWPGPSFLCHFNERNPWDGIYKGRANHLLDVAYMWGNYNQKYTNQNWTVARALAEDIVRFTAGKGTLPVFNKDNNVVTIYGPSDDNISSKQSTLSGEDTGRNHAFFRLADEVGGLDACLDAMVRFLQG